MGRLLTPLKQMRPKPIKPPKPFTPPQILHLVERARERRTLARRVGELEARLEEAAPEARLETASPRMQAVLEVVARAAGHDVAVLLRGENGTGKGVLARALHAQSPRRDRPFVVVNCPTLSEELLASELFGEDEALIDAGGGRLRWGGEAGGLEEVLITGRIIFSSKKAESSALS